MLILMVEICMVTVIVEVHVYCWKYHPIFSESISGYIGMRIYNELIKVFLLPTLKLIFVQAVSKVKALLMCQCI